MFIDDFKKTFIVNISDDRAIISEYFVTNTESTFSDVYSFGSPHTMRLLVTGELGKTKIIDRCKNIDISDEEILDLIQPML